MPGPPARDAKDKDADAQSLSGPRAFIADDEPLLLMLLTDLLVELGCEVVGSATTVDQGLQRTSSLDLDVAVLDIKLDRDIAPLVDVLRERGIPVVLATGYDPAEIRKRFPGSTVVRKPYSLESLRPVLGQAAGQ